MDELMIRPAPAGDLELVRKIGSETFYETFADSNTEADMQHYLAVNFSPEKLLAELSNPNSLFFLAWDRETPVGYLKLNTGEAQTDVKEAVSIEIERIYVKAAYHGKKVGQLLYEKALEIARELNKEYIWLGVWEKNPRAIRFYEKNGFMAFSKHLFQLGTDEQTDILMKKTLKE
ncbi:GNAT family N-acetyltransferase [Fluviicola sp.]|uniref:GNAT family N-acetyltransferase n=1 Tax=Fluviicola sp. TaxID=1917219 RepID=UPI0031DF473D